MSPCKGMVVIVFVCVVGGCKTLHSAVGCGRASSPYSRAKERKENFFFRPFISRRSIQPGHPLQDAVLIVLGTVLEPLVLEYQHTNTQRHTAHSHSQIEKR